jgi:hypothetical protein
MEARTNSMTIHKNWKERLSMFALGWMMGVIAGINAGWFVWR